MHTINTKQKNLLKLAIITMSFVQLGTNGIAPILAQIQEAFPQASAANVQFLMTFPSIFSLIFAMVCAFLSDHISKRILAVTGLLLVVAAGFLGFFFHGSLSLLFAWAAILGIGIGMVAPLAPALVNETFVNKEKQTMLGWQNASSSAGSMIMTFLGGILAVLGWHFGYLVYLIGIPGILFSIIAVPGKRNGLLVGAKTNDTATDHEERSSEQVVRGPFRLVIWREMIITFVLLIVFSAVPANLSMLVAERSLGATTISGTMSTLFLCGGMLFGILFGKVSSILKKRTDFVGALMLAFGSCIIALSSNVALICICCLIAGSSISLVMPTCMSAAGKLKGYETLNSSLILGTSFVGVFVTPVLTTLTANITGSESVTYRFFMVMIVALILSVLTIILKKEKRSSRRTA